MLLRAVRAAAVAALLSWGVIVALCVAGWFTSPATTVPLTAAVGVGSLVWSVAHLGSVSDGTTTISLVPLGLVAWPVLVVALAARTLRVHLADDDSPRVERLGGTRRASAAALGAFVGTYTALGVVLTLPGGFVPVHAVWWRSLLGAAVVAVVGALVTLGRVVRGAEFAPHWRDRALALAPVPVRRGATVGLLGAGLLLAAGLLPVFAAVVARWGQVAQVQSDLNPGFVGSLLLVVGQLLLVPNLAAWGLSWVAGPGFVVGADSTFTWTRSASVVLPNIPLLGALPDSGGHSPLWGVVAVVPVAVGAFVARRALGTVSRLSSALAKAQAVAVAVVTTVVLAFLGLVLSGGALGTQALAAVGPRAMLSTAALVGEVGAGAVAVLLWSVLRFNRGRR